MKKKKKIKVKYLPLDTSHKDIEIERYKRKINKIIGYIYGLK